MADIRIHYRCITWPLVWHLRWVRVKLWLFGYKWKLQKVYKIKMRRNSETWVIFTHAKIKFWK